MRRRSVLAVGPAAAGVVAVVLAGCSGSSTGDDASPTGSRASSAVTSATASPSATPSGSDVSGTAGPTASASSGAGTSGAATPSTTASVAQPPAPVVAAGNAGAWTLTRAAPGASDSRQIATVQCGQDGSVTADGLRLGPGAASLTLTDPAVTVTGTADLDAAGGTFRGRNANTAVAFTWTC